MLPLLNSAFAAPLSECERTYRTDELTDAIRSAESRWESLDPDGFVASHAVVLARLGCVGDPLTAPTIAAVHRSVALSASLAGDDHAVIAALASSLSLDPGYQFPATLVPEGHPIRAVLPNAVTVMRETEARAIVTLESGWIEVDGTFTPSLPGRRNAVLQQIDAQGRVVETRYVLAGAGLGEWDGAGQEPVAKPPKEPKKEKPAKEVVERSESTVRLVPGLVVGVVALRAGEPSSNTFQAGDFGGSGVRAGARLALSLGRLEVAAGLGYMGTSGSSGLETTDSFVVLPETLHLGWTALELGLHVDRLRIAAGPSYALGVASVMGLSEACVSTGCGMGDPEDPSWVGNAPYVSMSGELKLGGASARVGYDLVRGSAVSFGIEASGGASTDGLRLVGWGGIGLTVGGP